MTEYEFTWRDKFLCSGAKTIDDMIHGLQQAADELRAMKGDGIKLDDNGGWRDDYYRLITEDERVAKKHGFDSVDSE